MSTATATPPPSIANVILAQLGGSGRLSMMIGAKNFIDHNGALSFKVGRNGKGVNYVKITLDASDTYTVEFRFVRGVSTNNLKSKAKGIYADQLKGVIERGIEMYLSL